MLCKVNVVERADWHVVLLRNLSPLKIALFRMIHRTGLETYSDLPADKSEDPQLSLIDLLDTVL